MSEVSLRALADRAGMWVGCAVEVDQLFGDAQCREIVAREFNGMVAENAMKFDHLQPERGHFDFEVADRLLDFAAEHKLAVRGHALAWHNALPAWMRERPLCRAEALDILQEHIETVVGHFKGRVFCWDVVNEAIHEDHPGFRYKRNVWYQAIGEDYIEWAFRWAHAVDPEAELFYNDYDLQAWDWKYERALSLIKSLQEKNTPIHGLGFQFHTTPSDAPGEDNFRQRLERVRKECGLITHITELDINVPAQPTADDFTAQAGTYRQVMSAALSSKNCPAYFLWGVCDKYTWVRRFTKGERDHPLLFDKNYQPKPAYYAVRDHLQQF